MGIMFDNIIRIRNTNHNTEGAIRIFKIIIKNTLSTQEYKNKHIIKILTLDIFFFYRGFLT